LRPSGQRAVEACDGNLCVHVNSLFHPSVWKWLPLWTILDILLAFALIYPAAKMRKSLFEEKVRRLPISLILVSFIGTVTDALTRVFLLIPAGLYTFLAGLLKPYTLFL